MHVKHYNDTRNSAGASFQLLRRAADFSSYKRPIGPKINFAGRTNIKTSRRTNKPTNRRTNWQTNRRTNRRTNRWTGQRKRGLRELDLSSISSTSTIILGRKFEFFWFPTVNNSLKSSKLKKLYKLLYFSACCWQNANTCLD